MELDMKKTILIDLDGTVVNLWAEIKEYDPTKWFHEPCKWDVFGCCVDSDFANRELEEGFIFETAQPISGAVDGVNQIVAHHDILFVSTPWTSRSATFKYDWVEQHFPGMTDRLILTYDKTVVTGDILIDDKPSPLVKGLIKPTWKHMVYPTKYNHTDPKITISWDEGLADLICNN
jgi:5'(3')-deoxyribonucleotidase